MSKFPGNVEAWADLVLYPDDVYPWNFRTQAFYEEYRQKYAIAKLVRPKTILEIGVRFGYSAHSFLMAAPHADYTGIDFDEPSYGPYKGVPRKWATERLMSLYPNNKIRTFNANTQTDDVSRHLKDTFDMVHIDGDHSFAGALHDMKRFWPYCRRVMVVDDVIEIPEVARALQQFLAETLEALSVGAASSLRGSAIIVRDNV